MAEEIEKRIAMLAQISESATNLTRVYLSKEHRRAADLLMGWMREAGMTAHLDAIGNVCGRYESVQLGAPALLIGSHYDTVRDAGRWDGPLGIVTAISCIAQLYRRRERFSFAVEVIGFADEEGVRFGSTLLGSRALAGTLDLSVLELRDHDGVSMRQALVSFGLEPAIVMSAARRREDVLAYVELHIEQGPVLEAEGLAVGVVSAIAGATRLRVNLTGHAGHAGTVPMDLRRDALTGAAECVLAIEELCKFGMPGVVGTVGVISVQPGAANVIPGSTMFTVDVRAGTDAPREASVALAIRTVNDIAMRRGLGCEIEVLHENKTAPCSAWLKDQLADAIAFEGERVFELPSGAGHDGMAVIDLCDMAMLFVRCRGGISHNPAEHVETTDVEVGARILLRFIEQFQHA